MEVEDERAIEVLQLASASSSTCPVMLWCSMSTTGRSEDLQTLHVCRAVGQTPNSKPEKLYTVSSFLIISGLKAWEQPTQHMHRQIFCPLLESTARKGCFKNKSCSLLHPAISTGEQRGTPLYICNICIVWKKSSWKFICCVACTDKAGLKAGKQAMKFKTILWLEKPC